MSSCTTSVLNTHHHDTIDIPSMPLDKRIIEKEERTGSIGDKTITPCKSFVNPMPLGLLGFAITGFVIGMTNTGLVLDLPVMSLGACLTSGFFSQLIASILEIRIGNTFGAITFISYACFCLSYGIILLPGSGFFAAAEEKGSQIVNYAIGLFELPWCLLALVLFFGTLRQPMGIRVIHAGIVLLFFTGSLEGFTQIVAFTKVSGWIAVLLSLLCFYTSAALMYSPRITPISLPIGLPK